MAGRTANKLSARKVDTERKPGSYGDGHGLYLVVGESGSKRWELLLRVDGKTRRLGLGVYPTITLEHARSLTAEHRRAARAGTPLPSHREAIKAHRDLVSPPAAKTVKQAFAEMWQMKREQLQNPKHRQQWENTLADYAFPAIGDRPVAEVGAGEIIDLLRPHWNSKAETAGRVLQRLKTIFRYAIVRGDRVLANPCEGVSEILGTARTGNRARGHFASMPWRDVAEFIRQLRLRGGMPSSRLCFEFLILTAARSGEARGAMWSEIDLGEKVWTIPPVDPVSGARRTKKGRTHRVPLSEPAMAVLAEARRLHPDSELVFPSTVGKPLSDMALTERLRKMGLGKQATAHGFRSSFKDWAAEHGVDDIATEKALSHSDEDRVRAAYLRSDMLEARRAIMDRWAQVVVPVDNHGAI